MELAYLCVNLEQIHLPLCFIDISKVSEMSRAANKSGLKMAGEKSLGGNLLQLLAHVLCLAQKMDGLVFREVL